MPQAISWISLTLSMLSFGLFAYLAVLASRVAKQTGPRGSDVSPQGAGIPTAKDIADLAERMAKAGPAATAATLSVFFMTVALVAGGIVHVAVN